MRLYFRPNSLTWWAGVISFALGILIAGGWAQPVPGATGVINTIAEVVAQLTGYGDASPAGLMVTGLGLIGIRAALVQNDEVAAERTMMAVEELRGTGDGGGPLTYEPVQIRWDDDDDLPDGVRDPYGPGGTRE